MKANERALKAVRILNEVDVIAFPGRDPDESTAYKIAASVVPEISDKHVSISVPMIYDREKIRQEQMHIIPAGHQQSLQEHFSGTSVFMKTGSRLQELKESLAQSGMNMYVVEDCGMENEKAYRGIEEIPDHCKYYAAVIARMNKEG